MINHFLPLLKRHRGRIVNVSSLAAVVPTPNDTPYVASKYAVLGYSEALRREKHMWGIHVATILPGMFATGLTNPAEGTEAKRRHWDSLPQNVKDEYRDEYMENSVKFRADYFKNYANTDLSPVTNAIEHALFAKKPQNIYKAGRDSQMLIFLEWMRFRLMDRLLRSPGKMVPKALTNKSFFDTSV